MLEVSCRSTIILWERAFALGLISWARGCRNSSRRSVSTALRAMEVEKLLARPNQRYRGSPVPPRVKKVLSLAAKEARA